MNSEVSPKLILASSSPYRRELLQRFGLPFESFSPDIDESIHAGEKVADATSRLALQKARAVQLAHPNACILASDQLCASGESILGKPGSREKAAEQLASLSGRSAQFFTAICVCSGEAAWQAMDVTTVHFRALDQASIRRYLDREPAIHCAGSFMAEGLGITLFSRICSDDPTGLIGLPLIETARLLRNVGYSLP